MSNFLVIYVTYPSQEVAQEIVGKLLEAKLIACANMYPMQSMYLWEGEIKNEKEWVSIMKSTTEKWSILEKEIAALHPYDIPCITKWSANANESYQEWVNGIA